ncbi:unnamed protein product [Cuscuta europaea]|uniref:Uncharacterized protein n=1 Tax=Cuscuta europaea TaxID=41803 RepID=A0A9P0Z193_CUSEU|nr:unnamed protein product [Cuscuta europaea]
MTAEDSMNAEEEVSKSSPVRQVDSPEQHDNDVDSFDTAADMEHEVAAKKDVGASARASSKVAGEKKHRGPTVMAAVHNRKFKEWPIVILNESGQPIGPTPAVVCEFNWFLGTVARDSKLAPLNYVTWHKVLQTKLDNMWNYVLEKYVVPTEGQRWVFATLNDLWPVHKPRLKQKHFYKYNTVEERWANRPKSVPNQQFLDLLNYWSLEDVEEESNTNRQNRMKHDDSHNLGPISFALLCHTMKNEDPNKEEPSDSTMYKKSRMRIVDGQCMTKIYLGAEQNRLIRLRGRGVTKSKMKETNNKQSSYVMPEEFLQSVKEQLAPSMKKHLKQEVAKDVASMVLSQIKATNPGISLNIPEFCVSSKNQSSGHEVDGSNGQSSVRAHSMLKVRDSHEDEHGTESNDE